MLNKLPIGWRQRLVGDVFEMQLGKMLSKTASSGAEQYPYLANRHVQWGRVELSDLDTMTFNAPEREKYSLREGDLLVCEGGEVGRTAVWQDGPTNVFFQKAIHRLRAVPGQATAGYVAPLMRFAAERGLFSDLSSQTSIAHLTQEKLATLCLQFPPLPEQLRIAEILDTLDEAIRKTELVIKKLQQMKQGLLHDLLTRGINEHGELRDPQRHPEQFKDSPLGRIPKEWEVAPLCSRFAVKGGKRLPAGHAYSESPTSFRYLRVLDFFGKTVDFEELFYLYESTFTALARYEIRDDELYISIAGSIGHVGVFRNKSGNRTILTENAARLEPTGKINPDYVAAQANHSRVQAQIEIEKGTGGGVPKLALFRIEKLQFVWPDLAEQERCVARLRSAEMQLSTESSSLAKLRTLQQGLMDDLLTGRVRVNVEEATA